MKEEGQITCGKTGKSSISKDILRSQMFVTAGGVLLLLVMLIAIRVIHSESDKLVYVNLSLNDAAHVHKESISKTMNLLWKCLSNGDPALKAEREEVWESEIWGNFSMFEEIRKEHPETSGQIDDLEQLMCRLEEEQWWVADAANTPGDNPANLEGVHLASLAEYMTQTIAAMIELQKEKAASQENYTLLGDMTDFRGYLGLSNLYVLESLHQEDEDKLKALGNALQILGEKIGALKEKKEMLTSGQQVLLERLALACEEYRRTTTNSWDTIKGKKGKVSQDWLEQRVLPLYAETLDLLQTINDYEHVAMIERGVKVSNIAKWSTNMGISIIFIMAVLSYVVSRRNTLTITKPLLKLTETARKVGEGEDIGDLPVAREDEVGELTACFNKMRFILQVKNAQLQQVLEEAPVGMLVVSQDGTMMQCNKMTELMFGYSSGELVGKKVEMLVPMDNRLAHPYQRGAYAANPVAYNRGAHAHLMGEGKILHALRKDGKTFPTEISLNVIDTVDGKIIFTSILDITERLKAEKKVKSLATRLTMATESSGIGVWELDVAERMFDWNEQMLRIHGMEPGKSGVTLEDSFEFVHPEDREAFMAAAGKSIESGEDLNAQFRIIRKDDRSIRHVNVRGKAYKGDGGKPANILGTAHDITEAVVTREQIQEYARELEASNKELDDFAYIASHDLKEPLRGINNYSIFLLEDYGEEMDGDAKGMLTTMQDLCKRMESLINSLLYYSRVGRVDLAYEDTPLDEIVDDVLESIKIRLDELGVEVRRPQQLPKVHCDRVRVGEIFRNLLTNGMKYNDKEEKWIEVGWLSPKETNPSIDPDGLGRGETVFYVRDNGIGIPGKHLEKVFSIFKRLHAKDQFGGGTGAGLTIVKKIVERHNGHIWLQSEYGEGTTFYFTLGASKDTSWEAISI